MQEPGKACRQIAQAISDYLSAHPQAADSAQGIADWWLAGSGLQASLDEVREALALLQTEELVQARALADGRLIYRAAPRRAHPTH